MAKVFISYSSADRERVSQLVRVLRESDFEVWWDRRLMPHETFKHVLAKQIDEACAVVVIWTHNSIGSEWVEWEVDRAGGKLVSVRMDDCMPGSPHDNKHIEDMTSTEGPAYAFATMRVLQSIKFLAEGAESQPSSHELLEEKLARQDEMLAKILAATEAKDGEKVSVRPGEREDAAVRAVIEAPDAAKELAEGDLAHGFDTLKAHARHKASEAAQEWRDIGALAYDRDPQTALEAYREATRLDGSDFWSWIYLARLERRQAGNVTAARQAAEAALEVAANDREKGQAQEDLTDLYLMLGDVSGASQAAIQSLDFRRRVANRADTNSNDSRNVSISLDRLGDVAVLAGDLAAAHTAFEESLETRRKLAAANPGSAQAQRDVSASLMRLGDVAVLAGDLGAARTAFEESHDVLAKLAAANPGSAEAQRDVAVSLERLGDLAVNAGDLAAARTAFEESLETRRNLAADNPGSAQAQRDVSVSLERLGDVAVKAGDLAAAHTAFEESLETRRNLAAANPGSAEAQRDVSVSLNKLGDVAVKAGDLAAARTAFEESLETRRKLAAANPGSAEAQRDVYAALFWIGDIEMRAGNLAQARIALEESADIARTLAAANPGSAEAQRDVIVSLAKLAQMTGEVAYWKQALPIVEKLAAEGRLAPADAWMVDEIHRQIAAAED